LPSCLLIAKLNPSGHGRGGFRSKFADS
jgi:hypothetical protein